MTDFLVEMANALTPGIVIHRGALVLTLTVGNRRSRGEARAEWPEQHEGSDGRAVAGCADSHTYPATVETARFFVTRFGGQTRRV